MATKTANVTIYTAEAHAFALAEAYATAGKVEEMRRELARADTGTQAAALAVLVFMDLREEKRKTFAEYITSEAEHEQGSRPTREVARKLADRGEHFAAVVRAGDISAWAEFESMPRLFAAALGVRIAEELLPGAERGAFVAWIRGLAFGGWQAEVTIKRYGNTASWDVFNGESRIGHVRERNGDGVLLVFCFGRRIGHVRETDTKFTAFSRDVLGLFSPVATLQEAVSLIFRLYRRLVVNLGEAPRPELTRRAAEGG